MSYDPQELTPRDVIRGWTGDTGATEWLTDDTYDAIIVRWGVPAVGWVDSVSLYRAGVETILRVASLVERRISSFSVPEELAVSWDSNRTRSLRSLADQLAKKADELDSANDSFFGTSVTMTSQFLLGGEGGAEW